jgi:capsular exopolysaccharide synthesis family protein
MSPTGAPGGNAVATADAPQRASAPMPQAPPPGGLLEVTRVLWTRKWLILAITLLAIAAALVFSLARSQEYKATATLLFEPPATADFLGPGVGQPDDPQRAAATRDQLLTLDTITRRTSSVLRGKLSPEEVADSVDVNSPKDADVADIEASAPNRRLAAALANAYARSFIAGRRSTDTRQIAAGVAQLRRQLARLPADQRVGREAQDLRNRISELSAARALQTGNVELAQRARPPKEATNRHVLRNALLAAVLGALVAFGVASLLEGIDRRIRGVEDLEEIYDLPVLARIPQSRVLGRRSKQQYAESLLTTASGFSEEAEAFRMLRASLRYFGGEHGLRSMLIVSPAPGEGKSTIARFLAVTMATMGDRVVLVNADLRKPGVDGASAETSAEGLSLVLAGFELDDALTEVPVAFDQVAEEPRHLVELSSGPLPPNPAELLESPRMRQVLGELESRFDVVVIDTPALGALSDALALVPQVDGILVVGGLKQGTRNGALSLRKELALLGGRPLGIVANFWRPERREDYYSSYYY